MTVCLVECKAYSRNYVAVDSFTESQVATSNSAAYPKAAIPDNPKASGLNKFFENVKPLSDFVSAILDAAGSRIGKLLDFDNIFDSGNLIHWEIPTTGKKNEVNKSVKQDLPSETNLSVLRNENVTFATEVVKPHSPAKIPSLAKETQTACNSAVGNSQNKELEGMVFDGTTEDVRKYFEERLCRHIPDI